MANKLVAFISGSSGSGKNTVINKLLETNKNYGFITSYTTRAMREGDVEGKNYYFVTKEQFENKIKEGDMLEFDVFSDNYYGIGKEAITKKLAECDVALKDLTVAGVRNSKERVKDNKIVSFFFTVEKNELIERLKKRGEKRIKERMKFYNKEQKRMFDSDYVIKNVDLAHTLRVIKTLIDVEQSDKAYLSTKSCQEVFDKKINKYVNQFNKGKKVKPIKIVVRAGKVYIVDGVHRYLAALKCGKNICKVVLNDDSVLDTQNVDTKEWNKLVKMYK
jgi:guanylate kinase